MALILGIIGASSVLLMAYARHAGGIGSMKQEYLTIAANLLLPHCLLGLFALSQFDKIGHFACASAGFVIGGAIFFSFALCLLAFGIIERSFTAPIGGILYAGSWLLIGVGFFAQIDSKGKTE
jgi:uncharacterized membrane protein YgdD (TMEM256/DUF423 family)